MRQYFWASLTDNDEKTFGPVTRVASGQNTNALSREHTHMCDAISYKDDVYFCNMIDVMRVRGGSGLMTVVDTDTQRATPRTLAIWPSGGFNNAGVAQGPSRLLILESSGILKSVKFGNVFPSGVELFTNFASIVTDAGVGQLPDIRSTDPWTTRLTSATAQPARNCAMQVFNNKLHAFFPTETSGYHHLINNGNDASGVDNWTDATDLLPDDFKEFDGNIYIAEDTQRELMLVAYVTMSNVGVLGHHSQRTGGGGTYLFVYDKSAQWQEIYAGVGGGTPRGLLPLQNIGPYSAIPSGTNPEVLQCSDYAIMTYRLHDQFSRNVDVDIDFSINQGASWSQARRFQSYDTCTPLGSGIENLATSIDGIEYTFFWDYINDVGFSKVEDALLRVTPSIRD